MIVSMPLFVMRPLKTKPDVKMIFNLNNFRNWYYMHKNYAKEAYEAIAIPRVQAFKLPDGARVGLTFVLFKGSRRKSDRANVLCIHEKFFCDSMVAAGCMADDNDTIIKWSHYQGDTIDKSNPRVEIHIEVIYT